MESQEPSSDPYWCHGECGASEEHQLHYDPNNTVELQISPGETFSTAGHYPIIAGHTVDKVPLYYATIRLGVSDFAVAVRDGMSLKKNASKLIRITALKFEPQAYTRDYWLNLEREDTGPIFFFDKPEYALQFDTPSNPMDATGPFHWEFVRNLPLVGAIGFRGPGKAWIRIYRRLQAKQLMGGNGEDIP